MSLLTSVFAEQGGLGNRPDALDGILVQEASRLLRQRELGLDAGLLRALVMERCQLGNRAIGVLALRWATIKRAAATRSSGGGLSYAQVRPF